MLPGPYKVSNSEIQTFKDCRRKWWLTYYRRLKPLAQSFTGPLALGSRIHEALDIYYSTDTPLLDAHAFLVAEDRKTMDAAFRDSSELDSEADLGRIMLEGYLDWVADEGIDNELEMISTEEIISMPMLNGEVVLQGKLDMRVRRKSDGVRMFRDFKTVGGAFSNFSATAHMNEQILTYMVLEAAQNKDSGERSEGGIFTLLKKVKRSATAKPPFYEQFEVQHNQFTIKNFWQSLHGAVTDLMNVKKALDAGASHFQMAWRRPSRDCTWKCQFYAICPLFEEGAAVEDAIKDLYVVGDPYDYYAPSSEVKGNE